MANHQWRNVSSNKRNQTGESYRENIGYGAESPNQLMASASEENVA
jgi:hypothetical protein